MPNAAWLVSAAAMAIAMSATPGPNNTMVMTSGATYGFARTLPHIAGVVVGFPVMIAVLGIGGQPLLADPRVHAVLKWAGAAYLLWLAWHIATADPRPPGAAAAPGTPGSRPLSFVQAAAFQWVNPKAWIIAAGALVTFVGVGAAARPAALLLALVFGLVAVPSTTLWTLIGVGAARLLRSARAVRRFNLAMAALLVLSLIPVLVE